MTDRLHYISQQTDSLTHLEAIQEALDAGCRWIQLRIKQAPVSTVLRQAAAAKKCCEPLGAKLIINDYPHVAREVEAHGVHLGLQDMPIPEARAIVGDKLIIGGTANTFQDIQQRMADGADYVGLGPFCFTATKEKLSPLLGLDGYRRILRRMHEAGIFLPVIAIGGIQVADVEQIMQTGVHGIAVSGALTHASNKPHLVKKFYQMIGERIN